MSTATQKRMKKLSTFIIVFLLLAIADVSLAGETIRGHYCYKYGDRESLVEARATAKTLAIRDAVESYIVFIRSNTKVENFTLSEDMIQTISSGYVEDISILSQTENSNKICCTVAGRIDRRRVEKLINESIEHERNSSHSSSQSEGEDGIIARISRSIKKILPQGQPFDPRPLEDRYGDPDSLYYEIDSKRNEIFEIEREIITLENEMREVRAERTRDRHDRRRKSERLADLKEQRIRRRGELRILQKELRKLERDYKRWRSHLE